MEEQTTKSWDVIPYTDAPAITPEEACRLQQLGFRQGRRPDQWPLTARLRTAILARQDAIEAEARKNAKAAAKTAVARYRAELVKLGATVAEQRAVVDGFTTPAHSDGEAEFRFAARRQLAELERSVDNCNAAIALNEEIARHG
jgi:hypothetical protein